jgi:hypothetical protein
MKSVAFALSLAASLAAAPPYTSSVVHGELVSIALPPPLLKLDMNASNAIRSETGDYKPARYSFPAAHVPERAPHRLTDLYRYDRRRDVPIVSSGGDWVIAEYYLAGSHIPVARFQMLGKHVQRQEQLDRAGRTVRTIAIGWEDESGAHPTWIRVLDANHKLIAMAWRTRAFTQAPDENDVPDDSDLAFGIPDRAIKWHSKAAFVAAFDIDLDARGLSGQKKSPSAPMR